MTEHIASPAPQSGGVTTICFSRRLREPRALASSDLRAAGGLTSAASGASGSSSRRRLAQARELGRAFAPGGGEVLPLALMSQALLKLLARGPVSPC